MALLSAAAGAHAGQIAYALAYTASLGGEVLLRCSTPDLPPVGIKCGATAAGPPRDPGAGRCGSRGSEIVDGTHPERLGLQPSGRAGGVVRLRDRAAGEQPSRA